MAELKFDEATARFQRNEDKLNAFINGDAATTYLTENGTEVPSIQAFLNGSGNVVVDGVVKKAQEFADQAQASALRIDLGALDQAVADTAAAREETLAQVAVAQETIQDANGVVEAATQQASTIIGAVTAERLKAEAAATAAQNNLPTTYSRATFADLPTNATNGQTAFVTSNTTFYHFDNTKTPNWVPDGQGALANKANISDLEVLKNNAGPGDAVIIVEAKNGPALATTSNGTTRGTFLSEDIVGLDPRLTSIEATAVDLSKNVYNNAGVNDYLILAQARNGIALAVDPSGVTRGTFLASDIIGLSSGGGTTDPTPGTGSAVAFVDPANQGEAWMSIKTTDAGGEVIRYLDRSWRETWGYEKRGNITLAQTPNPAVGILAFGGNSSSVARPLTDTFPYHVIDENIVHTKDKASASAQAAAFLEGEYAARRGLPTVVAITRTIGSAVEADALDGSAAREEVKTKIAKAANTLKTTWGKDMFFDRISLSLLEGAPQTLKLTADNHYAAVARNLRIDVADAAKQAPLPMVVVSQSSGTRTDGTSEVILAEGELDFNHFSLDFVVAGPRYPYPLADGMPATLTPEGALLMSELEAIAASERLAKRDWFGPSIGAQASLAGAVITVPFSAMTNLVLRDPANHGFSVSGVTNGATIQSVAVNGKNVTLTMSAVPEGTLYINYAWGQTGDKGDGFTSNRGSLTDEWSQASRLVANKTHYRYGRSGRTVVVR